MQNNLFPLRLELDLVVQKYIETIMVKIMLFIFTDDIFQELDILTLGDQEGSYKERNKRTIGVLRELFPNLSKVS